MFLKVAKSLTGKEGIPLSCQPARIHDLALECNCFIESSKSPTVSKRSFAFPHIKHLALNCKYGIEFELSEC